MRALTTRVEWLKVRAGTSQAEVASWRATASARLSRSFALPGGAGDIVAPQTRAAPSLHRRSISPSFHQVSAGLSLDRPRAIFTERPNANCGGFADVRVAPRLGANEPNVHLCRNCGHATPNPNWRERTQCPSVPKLRARASRSESARTKPKSICGGFAGARLPNQIAANEAISEEAVGSNHVRGLNAPNEAN
jgi:hypothetical protein